MLRECGFRADRDIIGSINIWLKVLEGCAGMCHPKNPCSGGWGQTEQGTKHEGMKKIIKSN